MAESYSPTYCASKLCSNYAIDTSISVAVQTFLHSGCKGSIYDYYESDSKDEVYTLHDGKVSIEVAIVSILICFGVGTILGFLYQKQVDQF